jgi:hypothetical protein
MKLAHLSIAMLLAFAMPVGARSPNGAYRCYWVSGRLSAYNGTPTFRIWPTGTKRLLGVTTQSGPLENVDALPATLRRLRPSFDRDIWGSFLVCPLAEDHAGRMRMIVLADARRLTWAKR